MSNAPDTTYVGKNLKSFQTAPKSSAYTKVRMKRDDGSVVEYGTDTGLTMETECPWATSAVAAAALAALNGFEYQPYTANGANIDPAAELGDAISVQGLHAGIYQMNRKFGRHGSTSAGAPQRTETNGEVQHQTEAERKFQRKIDGSKLIDQSIGGAKYGLGSVAFGALHTDVQGTLLKVDTIEADVANINKIFTGQAFASNIYTKRLVLDVNNTGYGVSLIPTVVNIGGTTYNLVTWQ